MFLNVFAVGFIFPFRMCAKRFLQNAFVKSTPHSICYTHLFKLEKSAEQNIANSTLQIICSEIFVYEAQKIREKQVVAAKQTKDDAVK